MATSVIPELIDALVAAADDALPDINVLDGFGVTNDPGHYLMIGVDDPDGPDGAQAASSQQAWAGTGLQGARDEDGDITCAALAWNGDANQKKARDDAFAIVAAIEDLLRANSDLDVPGVLWTSYGVDTQLSQSQNSSGSVALIIFRVHFRARL